MKGIESISFEIEQNLEKPGEYLYKTEIKSILSNLFKKEKKLLMVPFLLVGQKLMMQMNL